MERTAGVGARRGATILFTTAAAVYVLDRVTKGWAEGSLAASGPIEVIPNLLRFRFATNPGGAFSILGSAPWFFAAATLGVSVVIVVTSFRRRSALRSVALGLVLGGALGNLTDRALRGPGLSGEVVDFIDLHLGTAFSWPVFNVADSAIVIGALLLAFGAIHPTPEPSGGEGEPAAGGPGDAR